MLATLLSSFAYGQEDPIKIGGKSMLADGSVLYATDVSMLNLLGSAGEVNMSLQYREAPKQWVVLITVPYKEINIPANGTLDLRLNEGSTLSLPVEREMSWTHERILYRVNNKDVYLMRIPYLATAEQVDLLAKAGNVNQVTIGGSDRTISFRNRNVFSNIVSRGREEILAMMSGTPTTMRGGAQQSAVASSDNTSSERTIHVTDKTKYFEVSGLDDLMLGTCQDGHFIVIEKGKQQGYIFDSAGNLTGKVRVSIRYQNLSDYYHPVFSDGIALVLLEDGVDFFTDEWITAAINYQGDTLSIVSRQGNKISHYPGVLVDGLTGAGYGGSFSAWGVVGSTYYFLDISGKKVKEVGEGSFIHSNNILAPHQICEGLRLFQHTNGRYGYLDRSGEIAISPIYADASDFSEGLAAVATQNGTALEWGYINPDGEWVVSPIFSNMPGDFHEGLAVAKKRNGKYVYIDKTGAAVSPDFDFANQFIGGYAMTGGEGMENPYIGSKAKMIDNSFKMTGISFSSIKPVAYDYVSNTFFVGRDTLSDGRLYSSDGNILLSWVGPPSEGIMWSNKYHCYLNLQGEIILQFTGREF